MSEIRQSLENTLHEQLTRPVNITVHTEPVMRVIVEAKDQRTAQKYIDAVLSIRKEIIV